MTLTVSRPCRPVILVYLALLSGGACGGAASANEGGRGERGPVVTQVGRRPFDGETFTGRIAFSSDGNFNDEDDWGAFPVAVAILDACGVTDNLVHVDFNNIVTDNDERFEREMRASVLGAAERYGLPPSVLFDCRVDADAAVASITNAVNASSADDPLYFVLAGPMEVPYQGIVRSDPEKRKFVYCISHSSWNDGFFGSSQDMDIHNKRDVIPSGVNWIQCPDGNKELAHPGGVGRESTPEQWGLYEWLKTSEDPRLNWIYTRLEAEQRCDISDATMTYFLLTGDDRCDLSELRSLIDFKRVPDVVPYRPRIRLEAENFRELDGFGVETGVRKASQRVSLVMPAGRVGGVRTPFDELYAADGTYDVTIGFRTGRDATRELRLSVDGIRQGETFVLPPSQRRWGSVTVPDVALGQGDEIAIEVSGPSSSGFGLDYVDLEIREAASSAETGTVTPARLDDPAALPGQVVVTGDAPGYLKYNGGSPVFLCGPDNPEDFFFRGEENSDGTRSGGGQEAMIARLAASGVNAFHCLMTRMRVCNIKDEGDDSHTPFVDHDPAKGLNEKVLDQWDGWLGELERHGIVVHLEFYNDATDVELMGWTLDADGNLHPDEHALIVGIVDRFEHRKNVLWGIEESANKLPSSRTAHFKKIGEVIAAADDHNHPIVQSFVVPDDPDGDFPEGGVMSDAYEGDPHIRVVTWLHVVPHRRDYEAQHREYLRYRELDGGRFVVMKNET
ncbi:MAG: hypothetical protein AAGJ97_01960, partial [Planctomycetota bacterium]